MRSIVFFLSGIAFLVAVGWYVFFSNQSANYGFAISARRFLQAYYWEALKMFKIPEREFPPFAPLYTIRVSDKYDDSSYLYSYLGELSEIDLENKFIVSKGFDGKIYKFIFGENVLLSQNVSGIADRPEALISRIVSVVWREKRTLTQIYFDVNRTLYSP